MYWGEHPQLGRLLRRDWDIHYVLGQAMVTDPLEPVLHNHISSASFFEDQPASQEGAVNVGLAVGQSQHGHLLLGEAMVSAKSSSVMCQAARFSRCEMCLTLLPIVPQAACPAKLVGASGLYGKFMSLVWSCPGYRGIIFGNGIPLDRNCRTADW